MLNPPHIHSAYKIKKEEIYIHNNTHCRPQKPTQTEGERFGAVSILLLHIFLL